MIAPDEAELLAARLLSGLQTKVGGSHLAHARRVARGLQVGETDGPDAPDDRAVVAALLHDVVEKAGVSIDDVRVLTGDERIVELVQLLTQRIGESDRSYLTRCASDPTALAIKRADLNDKFVLVDATASPEAIARVHWRTHRRIALLERIAATQPAPEELVVAAAPPRHG